MDRDFKKKLPLRKKRQFIKIVDAHSPVIIQNILYSIQNRLDRPINKIDSKTFDSIRIEIMELIEISRSHSQMIVNFFDD